MLDLVNGMWVSHASRLGIYCIGRLRELVKSICIYQVMQAAILVCPVSSFSQV